MKKKRIFAAVLLTLSLFLIFPLAALADSDETQEGGREDTVSDIMSEFSELIPEESGISLEENRLLESVGFDSILSGILSAVLGEKSRILGFFLTVIGFAVLSVVCETASSLGSTAKKSAGVGVYVIMSVTVYPTVYAVFESVRKSLESVSSFFGAALPIMTAITAASGSVKTAGIQAMNMNVTLGIVGAIATKILLPLSFAMLALALVSSFGDGSAGSVAKGIKSFFTFGLGIVTAVSSAAIALQTVIASASDSAALRAARYAAGGLIPVVGSSVSSALSTLAGGLAYAKSTVGAAAIAVIASASIAPLISLLVYRIIFSVAVTFLEYADNPGGVRCFSAYRVAFDTVISVYVMSTLVCIIQLIVFMKGGASL